MIAFEAKDAPGADERIEYVTVLIAEHLFGLPIERVQDVFMPSKLTPVPLAPPEIAGLLNLRGRIVTAIDMRCCLGLPPKTEQRTPMAVGIEVRNEVFGLLIDQVGEVLTLSKASLEPVPIHLDARLTSMACGIHRLEDRLLVVLDIERLLESRSEAKAA